jgi:hypothetical protein
VGKPCRFEDRGGEVGLCEISSLQISTTEFDRLQVSPAQVGLPDVSIGEVHPPHDGSPQIGAGQIVARQVGQLLVIAQPSVTGQLDLTKSVSKKPQNKRLNICFRMRYQ